VKWHWKPDLAHLTFAEFPARRRASFCCDHDATVTRLERPFGTAAVEVLVFKTDAMPGAPDAPFCPRGRAGQP